MPKVLRIINRFNLGGPTYNAAYLTKYLPDTYETLLVGGMKDDSEDSSEYIVESLGLKPIIIPEMMRAINFKQDRITYKKIKKIIREFKPDIVHTHAAKSGLLGRLAAYNCGVPVIVHTFHGHVFHSYFGRIKTTVFKLLERWLASKSSAIIAISKLQKTELVEEHKICEPEKMKVIPLGFDLQRFQTNQEEKRKQFRTEYNLKENELAIGIIGRLVPIKNHQLFVNAFNNVLQKTNVKIRAFIIGDGESRPVIEKLIDELNIPNNKITLTSWIREADIALAGLDVVCLTSYNEGTPVSLIEAQAAQKPIVSTAVGGIEDIVENNITALLSPNNNIEQFTLNLFRLVENKELRNKLANNSGSLVNQKFNYARLVKDMDELYTSLLKN